MVECAAGRPMGYQPTGPPTGEAPNRGGPQPGKALNQGRPPTRGSNQGGTNPNQGHFKALGKPGPPGLPKAPNWESRREEPLGLSVPDFPPISLGLSVPDFPFPDFPSPISPRDKFEALIQAPFSHPRVGGSEARSFKQWVSVPLAARWGISQQGP